MLKRRTLLSAIAASFAPLPKVSPQETALPLADHDEGPTLEELVRRDLEGGIAEAWDRRFLA